MSKLFVLAEALLQKAKDALPDEPSRAYVAPGNTPAHDCDQLTVSLRRLAPSGPFPSDAQRHARIGVLPVAEWWIEVVRCTPVQDDTRLAPDPGEMQDSAEQLLDDAWNLFSYFANQIRAGTLLPEGCELAAPIAVESVGPSGGLAASRLILKTSVTGA